ncbi:MAG: hypothetical protein GC193_10785 [Cryomorphaceae bacterium]|nr:hypothetical protein [Cryomorphaceae bacterium]
MRNFIPVAFTEEEAVACPVCVVRVGMEKCLDAEFQAFREIFISALSQNSLSAEAAEELTTAYEVFNTFYSDYRIAFVVNLCIWFAAERFGKAGKVPDVLAAYEEYRDKAKAAFQHLDNAMTKLFASLTEAAVEFDGLSASHQALKEASELFWKEVDSWTDGRRSKAFQIV